MDFVAREARCPSVCLIMHTAPKGRRALVGSGLNSGDFYIVELGIGTRSWRESTLGGEIDAVGDVLLGVDDELGRENIL